MYRHTVTQEKQDDFILCTCTTHMTCKPDQKEIHLGYIGLDYAHCF